MAPAIFVPEPPVMHGALARIPESLQQQWKDTYAKHFRSAQVDSPNEVNLHPQRARKAANQLLEVQRPTSYEEAMAMPEWQLVKRQVRNVGTEAEPVMKLVVVTIEARGAEPTTEDEPRSSKFFFDVPTSTEVADETEDGKKSGKGRRAAGASTN